MWTRGTVRLTGVALLGIEITIIAQASAVSAGTHPDGWPAGNGPQQTVQSSDVTDPGAATAAHDLGDWSPHDLAGLLEDIRQALAPHGPPVAAGPRTWTDAAEARTWTTAAEPRTWADEARRPARDTARRPPRTRGKPPAQTRAKPRPPNSPRSPIDDPTLKNRAMEYERLPVRTGVVRSPLIAARTARGRATVDLTRVVPRMATVRMSHSMASGWLKRAGLRTRSTGNCTSKHLHHCTSLDEVRTGTIARVIDLKRRSHCPIMVTGGTERGHAPGHYSHGNGYKLDISHNPCIDRFITKHHARAGTRSDGARLYRSRSGTLFARESDHWDILFR